MTAASFTPDRRIHISLNVRDIDAAVRFYSTLFGTDPSKRRDDYAKFEPTAPPVNLALNLSPDAATETRVSHFGVQVKSTDEVERISKQLEAAGLTTTPENEVTCCYAVQDKTWVTDPDGNAWEVFVVTQADTDVHSDRAAGPEFGCCPTTESSSCC